MPAPDVDCRHVVKMSKNTDASSKRSRRCRLERGSRAPPAAWNSKMTSVRPSACVTLLFHLRPDRDTFHQDGSTDIRNFFSCSLKEINSGFGWFSRLVRQWQLEPIRGALTFIRVPPPPPQTIDYTDYGLVSLAQQCFISYARSNIIKVWARTGNQLRRKRTEKLHLCIENVINTPRHKGALTYVTVHQSAHQNEIRQYIKKCTSLKPGVILRISNLVRESKWHTYFTNLKPEIILWVRQ